RFGPGEQDYRRGRLAQITGNWLRFENVELQPAGRPATVVFRYRNGKRVDFTAKAVRFQTLLTDVQAYLRSNPRQLDWRKINVEDIGYRLVAENETKYLGETVATWSEALDPPADHFDDQVGVETPLSKAGVYLLTAKMEGGNEGRVIVWMTDTAIVRKPLDDANLYFVADATTGGPVPNATVEFFGWQHRQLDNGRAAILTSRFAATTDENGFVAPSERELPAQYQWLAVARTKEGRFAHLGFDGVWYAERGESVYQQNKAYLITDRPVYRPGQPVRFKFWVRRADYALDDRASAFAGEKFTVRVTDPRGETALEKTFTADEYGGFEGSHDLPTGATLGQYGVYIVDRHDIAGGGTFRVEEYKKPEFEVTVDAPSEPVMLGEPITATIRAKYYFGSPVTNAKVRYKVTRTKHEARWYPVGRWDWFYGRGYWWFAPERAWYPGFARWGCLPPLPPWHWSPPEPPEVVAENEVTIGEDGAVEVTIDTAVAKEVFGDSDHRYEITAEVTDASRRTITGTGGVFAPREPFQVFAWVDRGFYRAGDPVTATFKAQTIAEKPVAGEAKVMLYRVTYDGNGTPAEKAVETWDTETGDDGEVSQTFTAAEAGQYRVACVVTDEAGHAIEGGYLLTALPSEAKEQDRRDEPAGSRYRYNSLELTSDRREYRPGDTARLLVAADRSDATVLLFVRAENGLYPRPRVLRLSGKAEVVEVPVTQRDMPNAFVEAVTIADGQVHTVVRELFVPPQERVVNVAVEPSKAEYKPGEAASVKVTLTDEEGKPVTGAVALTMYDRSIEYVSGGSNVPDIREFFWKWRRSHNPQASENLSRLFGNLQKPNETGMQDLGAFGHLVPMRGSEALGARFRDGAARGLALGGGFAGGAPAPAAAPAMEMAAGEANSYFAADTKQAGAEPAPLVEATVRSEFADTALWEAGRVADENGVVELSLTMPENLTGWKVRAWAMGDGTKVGEATAEVVTRKNLLVRLQAPRFFTETDEVVLSANVHNYLDSDKQARVGLELEGETLAHLDEPTRTVTVPAGGEVRVDWRVRAANPGEAVVTMKALTDEESDAMRQSFPVNVHGMLRTESYAGTVRPDESEDAVSFTIPEKRRVNDTLVEVRFSPSLAAAMVDALPYLADYPYGCTEQTLNRFLPTVITQGVLKRMDVDLAAVRDKRTNLNPQEVGDAADRAAGWGRIGRRGEPRNPVWDEAEVAEMAREGLARLVEMQAADGGWGWFPGAGQSNPHLTALVVHGLMTGKANGLTIPDGVLERGVEWLKGYQQRQIAELKNAEGKVEPYKAKADNLDAFVFLVLVEAGSPNGEMESFLYRDRQDLSLYALAMYGLGLEQAGSRDRLDMVLRNLSQFVVIDDENDTAYLRLPNEGYWWFWYGSEVEANAYYLKLLAATDPKGDV
ncbi:MAG TPA: MG2 domain-containing protein, partial [Planctomycetaceae bacterium]